MRKGHIRERKRKLCTFFLIYINILAAQISTKKPYFVTPLSNATVKTGQRVKLECEAKGEPIPELSWTHDGKPIEESRYHRVNCEV